jgi:hypothetical protein
LESKGHICRVVRVLALLSLLLCPSKLLSQGKRFEEFVFTPPLVGEIAPDFSLKTLAGEEFTLNEAYANRPVVIEFGSYT